MQGEVLFFIHKLRNAADLKKYLSKILKVRCFDLSNYKYAGVPKVLGLIFQKFIVNCKNSYST